MATTQSERAKMITSEPIKEFPKGPVIPVVKETKISKQNMSFEEKA